MSNFQRKREFGQATMEFLILLPLLLSVIVLIVYGGWWSYSKMSAQNFAYSSCTGVSRSRGFSMESNRGYTAAYYTQHLWDVNTITNVTVESTRLGSKECRVTLKNRSGQEQSGSWNFQKLAESRGFAFYPPFMSCDGGLCR